MKTKRKRTPRELPPGFEIVSGYYGVKQSGHRLFPVFAYAIKRNGHFEDSDLNIRPFRYYRQAVGWINAILESEQMELNAIQPVDFPTEQLAEEWVTF